MAKTKWQELADEINSGSGYHLLTIGHRVKKNTLDRNCYERSAIQRTNLHEGLFSIFLSWQAIYDEIRRGWFWKYSPRDDGNYVNAIDNNILEYPEYTPSIIETTHGNIIRIGDDIIVYPEYYYPLDPVTKVKLKEKKTIIDDNVHGGIFVLPPSYEVKLYANQIQKPLKKPL